MTLKTKFVKTYLDFQKSVFKDCKYPEKAADIPMHFYPGIYGKIDEEPIIFMAPGFLMS